MQDSKGIRYSALLHGAMLLLLLFGLPSFLERKPDPEPQAISVDILPVAPVSNVKPHEETPEKPEPKKPVAEEKTERKPTPETKKVEEKKPDAVPLPKPVKPEIKKPEKKLEKKPVKTKKEDSLDDILKSVKETAKASESKKPTEKKPQPANQHAAKSDNYDPAMRLSMSETDAIRQQYEKCWDVPAGAKDAYNLAVTLRVVLNEDGSVVSVALAKDESRYSSDSFFRAAADSAIRAVHRCSPLKNLPSGKYSTWRELELGFDPKDMLY